MDLSKYEFELKISDYQSDLYKLQLAVDSGISKIGLVDKSSHISLVQIVSKIKARMNQPLEILPHYSIANHYDSSSENAWSNLKQTLVTYNALEIDKTLVVSGPAKRKFDSVKAVSRLANDIDSTKVPDLAVAFNPYLPGTQLRLEYKRLAEKLKYGLVTDVYLQIGIELDKLITGLEYIKGLCGDRVSIHGCLLIPTAKIRSSLKFRPWSGVILNEKYLQDEEYSWQVTMEILDCYKDFEVDPYIELMPFKQEHLSGLVHKLN